MTKRTHSDSRIATRTGTVALAILILVSTFAPFVAFSTPIVAAASSSDLALVEDFEDGDINIETDGFRGWNGNTGNLSTTSTNTINGTYSGEFTTTNAQDEILYNISSPQKVSNFTSKFNITTAQTGDTSERSVFRVKGEGESLAVEVLFEATGAVKVSESSGVTDTGATWSSNTTYTVEVRNVDYSADTFELVLNGNNLGTYNLYSDISEAAQVGWYSKTSVTGATRTIKFDDLKQSPISYSDDFWHFEDEKADSGMPEQFKFVSGHGNGGDISIQTHTVYNGSQALQINDTASGGTIIQPEAAPFDATTENASLAIWKSSQSGSDSNTNQNESLLRLKEDSTIIAEAGVGNDGYLYINDGRLDQKVGTEKWVHTKIYAVDTSADTVSVVFTTTNREYRYTDVAMQNPSSNGYTTAAIGDDEKAYFDDLAINGTSTQALRSVSGTVKTQADAPVANATVTVVGSKKPTLSKARSHLDTLSDPTPTAWDEQASGSFSLFGSSGALTNTSSRYAAIYQHDDLGAAWDDTADLSNPLWNNAPTNQQVSIIVGKQSDCGFLSQVDEYNRQISGCAATTGSITIEKLSPTGGVISSDTVDISQQTDGGYAEPADVNYASYTFKSAGIYRISVKGSSFSYLVKAGSLDAMLDKSLETINGQLTQFSQNFQSELNDGVMVRETVTTDSNGSYSVGLPPGVKVVSVSARKVSGVSTEISASKMRDGYNSGQYEGALYIPSGPKRVEVPDQNVDLTMTEVSWPPNGNLSKLQSQLESLRQQLDTITSTTIVKKLPASPEATLDELRSRYRELAGLIRANPVLRETYLQFSDRSSVATAGDLSKSQLKSELAAMNQALAATASTGDVAAEEPTVEDSTVDQRWRLSGIDLEAANVSVIAHWTNGTSKIVPAEYLRTNADLATSGGVVRVVDYPLGSKQPAAVQFELTVAGQNGVVHGRAQATNPSFNGTLPSIAAIELNTLHPGPADPVSMQIHPASDSSFRRVVDTTVYAPDGTALSSTIENGDTVRFDTNGVGVHTAKLTLQTTGGHNVSQTVRVQAHDTDLPAKPSVRARASPLGVFAVVGDGFSGGDVDVNSESMVVTARVPDSADAPNRIHVFTDSLSTGATPTTVRVVKGDQARSVSQHLYVTWHTKSLPTEAITWRGENGRFFSGTNEPITRTGSTRYGLVTTRANGTTIETYTRSDGSVIIDPVSAPNGFDRAEWRVEIATTGINIPFLDMVPVGKVTA